MKDILTWFKEAWQATGEWFNSIIEGILNWFESLPLRIYDHFLDGIVTTMNTLQPPEFIQTGLQSVISQLPPDVGYFLALSGIAQGFSIYGTAVVYSYLKKMIPFWG